MCPSCFPWFVQPHTATYCTASQASLSVTYAKHSSSVEALCVGFVLKYPFSALSVFACASNTKACRCAHVLLLPRKHHDPLPPTNSSPCWITALPSPPPPPPPQFSRFPCLWLSDSVGPGHSPVVRPALNTGLLPPNYQLQSSASTPGAGQAGNELSPLGWTSGWAVYGGGWAQPSGGVNWPSRGRVGRLIHQCLITEWASRCTAVRILMPISSIDICHYYVIETDSNERATMPWSIRDTWKGPSTDFTHLSHEENHTSCENFTMFSVALGKLDNY